MQILKNDVLMDSSKNRCQLAHLTKQFEGGLILADTHKQNKITENVIIKTANILKALTQRILQSQPAT